MDRSDIQSFLTSRRARLTPEQAGLSTYGERRRVTGLRREEVAMLTGVSVDYYARLERGQLRGASESVLEALARALQLDDAERQHLFDLARSVETSSTRTPRRPKSTTTLRPAVRSLLDGMTGVPAYVRNGRGDILAANDLARALYGGALDDDKLPVNLARFLFLEPHSRGFFLDWDQVADDLVGAMRVEAGRNPHDRTLSNLIGELTTRSDSFAIRWARQNVRLHPDEPETAAQRCDRRHRTDLRRPPARRRRPHDHRVHRRPGQCGRRSTAAARRLERHRPTATTLGASERNGTPCLTSAP